MRQELCDRVALLGIHTQKMRDKVLGRLADIVPPWRKEGILALGNLLRQDLNALIIERWEAAKKRVENATQGPHIDGLGVPLILDNLGCRIPDSAARSHGLLVPYDLGQAEIGNLDLTNSTRAYALDELALINLVLVTWLLGFRVLRGDKWNGTEEDVFGLDVTVQGVSRDSPTIGTMMWVNLPMNYTLLLMQILQSLCYLCDNMPGEILAEVRQTHNLVEQLAARCQFKDDVVVLARLGEVDKLDDVGMVKLAHDLHLFQNIGSLLTVMVNPHKNISRRARLYPNA